MQILLVIILILAIVAFIIYKINNQFGTKEIIIFVAIIIISILVGTMTLKNQEEKVPHLFKAKYEKEKNVLVEKFSFERVNNKTLSSNTTFIYDFSYIIKKDNQEFVCKAKDVKINKIEDEYVFENFEKLNESCNRK